MGSEDPTWNLRHAELQELVTARLDDKEVHGLAQINGQVSDRQLTPMNVA